MSKSRNFSNLATTSFARMTKSQNDEDSIWIRTEDA